MFKGTLSYILFCLDAYSQFVYAIPLKDKTSVSVLQGFLALFSTTGWPEAIYLDNETSFQKTAKLLIKVAPIKILYSTPYCQFQNWSENYIKNFKKTFLKILNDSENPQQNANWPLLLPTVTQALNRQLIPSVGRTRESIHFNATSDFFPLAHISDAANYEFNESVNNSKQNAFSAVLQSRLKDRSYSKKAKPPQFHETQLVFMKDQSPSTSTILKIPSKGPFRIEKLENRNATLIELETGKSTHSHIQNLRPLALSEFRLLLNNNWDLNSHNLKAGEPLLKPSIFDTPSHPVLLQEVQNTENTSDDLETALKKIEHLPSETSDFPSNETLENIGLEKLFETPPLNIPVSPPQKPPNITIPIPRRKSPRNHPASNTTSISYDSQSDSESEFFECSESQQHATSFNNTNIHLDISQTYHSSLRAPKSVTFLVKSCNKL
jgi:hypothetical protein